MSEERSNVCNQPSNISHNRTDKKHAKKRMSNTSRE